jgi:hypothetical protein
VVHEAVLPRAGHSRATLDARLEVLEGFDIALIGLNVVMIEGLKSYVKKGQ